jgi:hypothetical protein
MSALSSLLVQDQVVPVRAIEEALQRQVIYGGQLDTNLLELGAVGEEVLVEYKARVAGMPPASLEEFNTVDRDLIRSVPRTLAERFSFVPLRRSGRTLRVAVCQSENESRLSEVENALDLEVEPVMTSELRLCVALKRFYGSDLPSRFTKLAGLLESRSVPRYVPKPRPTPTAPPARERDVPSQGRPGRVVREKSDTLKMLLPASGEHETTPADEAEPRDTYEELRPETATEPPTAAAPEPWIDDDAIVPAPEREMDEPDPVQDAGEVVPAPSAMPPPAAGAPWTLPGIEPRDLRSRLTPSAPILQVPPPVSDALMQIEDATTREEIFDAAVGAAAGLFEYAALFVIKGSQAFIKAASGAGVAANAIGSYAFSVDTPGVLWTVSQTRSHYVGPLLHGKPDRDILGAIALRPPLSVVAIPVVLKQRVVAVILGASPADRGAAETVGPMLVLGAALGRALERLILERKRTASDRTVPSLDRTERETDAAVPPDDASSRSRRTTGTPRASYVPGPPPRPRSCRMIERPGQVDAPRTEVAADGPHPVGEAPGKPDLGPATDRGGDDGPASIIEAVSKAARDGGTGPAHVDDLEIRTRALAREQGFVFPESGEGGATLEVIEPLDDEAPTLEVVAPIDAGPPPMLEVVAPIDAGPPPTLEVVAPIDAGPPPTLEVVAPIDVEPPPTLEVVAPIDAEPPLILEVVAPIDVEPPPTLEVVAPIDAESTTLEIVEPLDEQLDVERVADIARPTGSDDDRPARGPHDSIPSVIVDMGQEIETLVALALGEGEDAERAARELVAAGEEGLPSLVRRFPRDVRPGWESFRHISDLPAPHGKVLEFLGRFGDVIIPYVLPILRSKHVSKRYFAVMLLGTIESDEALDAIGQKLLDPDPRVAALAGSVLSTAIERRPLPGAVFDAIRSVLSDPQAPDMYITRAAEAVSVLHDRGAVPALIDMVRSARGARLDMSLVTLRAVTGQDFGKSWRRWSAWWKRAQSQHRVEWLIEALGHGDESVRDTAFRELSAFVPEDFGFVPSGPRRERDRARQLYVKWWKETGRNLFRDG